MIDENDATVYVSIPDYITQGCSEDIVIFHTDGSNYFTYYGNFEGLFLFFDMK